MERIKIFLSEKDAIDANEIIKAQYEWKDDITRDWCLPIFYLDEDGNNIKESCHIIVLREHLELLSGIDYSEHFSK